MENTILCDKLDEIYRTAEAVLDFAGEIKMITFSGSLGAGKTTLIKAICEKMNVVDAVSSPSFSILNEYKTASGDWVYHFDFYRIKSLSEVMDLGYEHYFYSDHYCLIEWPEMVEPLIDMDSVSVRMEVRDEQRIIKMKK